MSAIPQGGARNTHKPPIAAPTGTEIGPADRGEAKLCPLRPSTGLASQQAFHGLVNSKPASIIVSYHELAPFRRTVTSMLGHTAGANHPVGGAPAISTPNEPDTPRCK